MYEETQTFFQHVVIFGPSIRVMIDTEGPPELVLHFPYRGDSVQGLCKIFNCYGLAILLGGGRGIYLFI